MKLFSVLLEGRVEAHVRGTGCGGQELAEVGPKASAGWSTPDGNHDLPT